MTCIKRPLFLGCALFALNSLNAFDYEFSGRMENFSKIGFNNSIINSKKGIYPTESFVDVVGMAQVKLNLLPKHTTDHKLSFSLGGTVAGIVFDKTKNEIDQATGMPYGSIVYNFIGGYHGYFFNKFLDPAYACNKGLCRPDPNSGASHARPYVLDTAFLQYDYKDIFGFKLGRYEANIDFMSGSNQGWELYYQPFKTQNQSLKFWWWSSYGRGLAFNSWVYEFYATTPYLQSNGKYINYGWHGITATYNYKRLSAQFDYYFSPKTYNAPGFKLIYDTNTDFKYVGFRSQTMVMVMFPMYYSGWKNDKGQYSIWDGAQHGSQIGKNAVSLNIRQIFWWDKWTAILGIYNTFGNADAFLGSHTMPLGNNNSYVGDGITESILAFDFWDNTAYDGLADAVTNANTFTIYGSIGGIIRRFAWHIAGRVSHANRNSQGHLGRANEYSLALNLSYAFTHSIFANLKLQYYGVQMNEGYQVGYFGLPQFNNPNGDYSANYQDRSNLMTNLTLKF
ncbi:outer membrane family protein [Helicobacter cetorum]|uniref:outer membrane family protein n=1 Tax=Helicobacter cetorum TaxID=138563 RepID=UPI000CF06E9E|nr:outer membrane family protein [Helicobacter cetorum]